MKVPFAHRQQIASVSQFVLSALDQIVAAIQVWGGRVQPQIKRLSTQVDKTVTALSEIPALLCDLVAGRTYQFEGWLYTDADVTGGMTYSLGGTATAASVVVEYVLYDDSANNLNIVVRRKTLSETASNAGTTAGVAHVFGTIVCDTSGTFGPRFAQNTANGTSSVLINSTFTVREIF